MFSPISLFKRVSDHATTQQHTVYSPQHNNIAHNTLLRTRSHYCAIFMYGALYRCAMSHTTRHHTIRGFIKPTVTTYWAFAPGVVTKTFGAPSPA